MEPSVSTIVKLIGDSDKLAKIAEITRNSIGGATRIEDYNRFFLDREIDMGDDYFEIEFQYFEYARFLSGNVLEIGITTFVEPELIFFKKLSDFWKIGISVEWEIPEKNLGGVYECENGENLLFVESSCVAFYYFNRKERFWETIRDWNWQFDNFLFELEGHLTEEEISKIIEELNKQVGEIDLNN